MHSMLSSHCQFADGKEVPMIITIRVSDLDGALIKRYAHFNKETVSSLLKRLVMDQIEEDFHKLVEEMEVRQ